MSETKASGEALHLRLRRRLNIDSKTATDPKIITVAGICTAVALGLLFDPPAPVDDWRAAGDPAAGWAGVKTPLEKSADIVIVTDSATKLHSIFRSIGYRLERVRTGDQAVPPVFVAALPSNMRRLGSVKTRKAVFIGTMLPLILRVNEEITARRQRLLGLMERIQGGQTLSAGDSSWLAEMRRRYEVGKGNFTALLLRVDAIPPSLALAQAAEESGWGTSRFAREGNALFGQRTYRQTPGIVPRERPDGELHKVKSFDRLLDGVRSYARNLNIHPAYAEFRSKRAAFRKRAGEEAGIGGFRLAETLVRYSEQGTEYVRTIKTHIRANNLHQFDNARLSKSAAPRWLYPGF